MELASELLRRRMARRVRDERMVRNLLQDVDRLQRTLKSERFALVLTVETE
jgi:hypothetical protein